MGRRNTYAEGPRTSPKDYPRSPEHEAAKWVMTTARRFLAEKDTAAALDEAVMNWVRMRQEIAAAVTRLGAEPMASEEREAGCTCGETWPCPLHGGPPVPGPA